LEFTGLVQPTDAERTLNGFRLRSRRPLDWEQQLQRAVDAFQSRQVVILAGEQQAESLDEEFNVHPGTEVTFLRLTLLVGG
jgi:hypothetical protein